MSARLRSWFRAAPVVVASSEAGATDGDLVRRFTETRDDKAFAELFRRHAPMVLATCRRVLHPDVHTADDAFQATFLVLATKAGAFSPPERVGAWLHGVAVHVARKAQAWARKLVPMPPADLDRVPAMASEADPGTAELRAKIDEVLAGLPSKYRSAVVLCDLEQRSRAEAAGVLGWSEGTLSSRLSRARKLLADRLARRGVVVPATGLGVLLPAPAVLATVPGQLAASTLRAAALVAAGAAPGEASSAPVAALAREVPMHTKFKPFAVALIAAALGLGGLYALTINDAPTPDTPPAVKADPPAETNWVTKHTFKRETAITTVALNSTLVAAGDGMSKVVLWDVKSGQEMAVLGDFARSYVEEAKPGKEQEAGIFAVGAGEPKPPAPIGVVRFSPGGAQLFVISGEGESIHQITVKNKDRDAPFLADFLGKAVGIASDGGHSLHVSKGKLSLLVLRNKLDGNVPIFEAFRRVEFEGPNPIEYAAASDEKTVATVSLGALCRWQSGTEKPVWGVKLADTAKIDVTGVLVAPGGKWIAVTGGAGQVWVFDPKTGKLATRIENRTGAVRSAMFSPDSKQIVTGCEDNTAHIYDCETGKELAVLKGHTGAVTAVAFGFDGDTIATGSTDKTVRIWEYRRPGLQAPVVPHVSVTAPIPKGAGGGRMEAVFGSVTDPESKYKYELTKDGALRITVPTSAPVVVLPSNAPDISRESLVVPQFARKVRGDFALTVRVSHAVPEDAGKAAGAARAVVSAGLAVTDTTVTNTSGGETPHDVRFVYAQSKGQDGWTRGRTLYYRETGTVLWGGSMTGPTRFEKNELATDGTVYLRLIRDGDNLTTQTGPDGKRWHPCGSAEFKNLGPELRVGPVAFQSTDRDYTATFSEYEFKPLRGDERTADGRARPVPANAEERAVRFVEGARGRVTRDTQKPGKPVVGVSLIQTKVTDVGLKELAGLKELTSLDLSGCVKMTDAGLKELTGFNKLADLNLLGCEQVTDAGLKELAALKNLTRLSLYGCKQVTDAGLKELAELKALTSLGLNDTKVTDAGLKELAKLTNLAFLNLPSKGVTVAGVTKLQKSLPRCSIVRD